MAGQGSVELGANRERSVKKCEPTKVPACGGRLCLPDSRGAGAGRLPPLLGRPEGQNEMDVDLKDVDLKAACKAKPARLRASPPPSPHPMVIRLALPPAAAVFTLSERSISSRSSSRLVSPRAKPCTDTIGPSRVAICSHNARS